MGLNVGMNASVAIGDGENVLFALQEERLTREKNYTGFPNCAIRAALEYLSIPASSIDLIGVGSTAPQPNRLQRDDYPKLLADYILHPRTPSREYCLETAPVLQELTTGILRGMGFDSQPIEYYDHHTCHAYAARMTVGDPASTELVVTSDGFGDGLSTTISAVRPNDRAQVISTTRAEDSIGLLYFWTTWHLGFRPHEDEYKVMGLAPYADAPRAERLAERLGKFIWPDPTDLTFRTLDNAGIERLWPLIAQSFERERFDIIAGSVQTLLERGMSTIVRAAVQQTGIRRVLGSGGVFMNVKLNKQLANAGGVTSFRAMPSAGDESLALGAYCAAFLSRIEGDRYEGARKEHAQRELSLYLGQDINDDDITAALHHRRLPYDKIENINSVVAELLARGAIVGRCSGRAEFGARALGNRSILADPAQAGVVRELNLLIKHRDFWMPFAPVIPSDIACRYISNPKKLLSPDMTMTFNVRSDAVNALSGAMHPADLTCRPQILERRSNERFYDLLYEYGKRSGHPVLLNTSLNIHGEPIAASAEDAVRVLEGSSLKYLQLGDYLVRRGV